MMVAMVIMLVLSVAGNVAAAWKIGNLRQDKAKQKELSDNEVMAISSEFRDYKKSCYCKELT